MDAFVAGAWRTARRGEIYIGGQWRRLTRAEAYITSAWRNTLSFVAPMTLTATPSVAGYRSTPKPTAGTVITDIATATPSGGAMPYQYSWTASAGVTIGSPANASTNFSAYLVGDSERDATATVTCTDTFGSVATASVSLYFVNQSSFA